MARRWHQGKKGEEKGKEAIVERGDLVFICGLTALGAARAPPRASLSKPAKLCYMRSHLHEPPPLFPGSSAVEQPAVNRLVAGSNPARGAKHYQVLICIFSQA